MSTPRQYLNDHPVPRHGPCRTCSPSSLNAKCIAAMVSREHMVTGPAFEFHVAVCELLLSLHIFLGLWSISPRYNVDPKPLSPQREPTQRQACFLKYPLCVCIDKTPVSLLQRTKPRFSALRRILNQQSASGFRTIAACDVLTYVICAFSFSLVIRWSCSTIPCITVVGEHVGPSRCCMFFGVCRVQGKKESLFMVVSAVEAAERAADDEPCGPEDVLKVGALRFRSGVGLYLVLLLLYRLYAHFCAA